jgi:serine/threonine protein kinase
MLGLSSIHKAKMVHGDLKPENVLIMKKGGKKIKISDLGSAREDQKTLMNIYGT